MRIPPRITKIGAAGALASALLIGGTAVAATPAVATTHVATAHVRTVHANDVGSVCYSQLPSQAHDTLSLIDQGGPFPYPGKDGSVFTNTEGVLPAQSASDYYHEYTVITPGAPTRGARRIVTGEQPQEDYYTADHYKTFNLVDRSC
ncbi:ribonuclease domain-containing protein [Streptomyces albospinus]|nr:ribonuclease domain-containing protein [Streptomyces albospinus]